MNTYSGGPEQSSTNNVPNLSEWKVTKEKQSRYTYNSEAWIEEDLTTNTGKTWTTSSLGYTTSTSIDITNGSWKIDNNQSQSKLFKKHNRIIWQLIYDKQSKSITLQTTTAKLYKASSTNPTTKAIGYKQVYFAEIDPLQTPQQPIKNMTIKVVMNVK